ncbi:hypothetical protein PVAP13_2KG187100 [Panicum virgatum]|uniref:Rx N-terminal domain-containing protein n=1 Tax=Panicum virgatum TaxID=38727 RepID=A0A8T0W8N4_PANVG|nr:hypothetical protein PVAP13_2KG187100 [Panicum virgatum]
MAELVCTAIVQETASPILSGIVQKYEEKEESNANRNLERLEMAHIRLEAALEISNKWQIADASLLRWRRKLKHAAQECDDTLHKYKQRILEDKQMEQDVKNSCLPNRIAHVAKSFVFSILNRNNNELSRSIAQRFEWYANGASEFMRFIELGGTPCCHMPFDSLVKNLFAGKELHHKIVRENKYPSFQFRLVLIRISEHGTNVALTFDQYDGTPEGHIFFSLIIQLSERTDILGIAHFSWRPSIYLSYQKEQWEIFNNFMLQWARPNPFCCKHHGQHEVRHFSNLDMAGLSEVLLELVISFNLHCQVSMSVYSKQKTLLSEDIISMQDYPYLKVGISFAPHGSLEDMLSANRSSEIAVILEDIMLPNAIDYFHQNAEEMVYQMLWKSKHGYALIQVEKPFMSTRRSSMRTQRTFGGATKMKLLRGHDEELIRNRIRACHLLDLWVTHAPIHLQRSIINWKRKEKKILLAAPQLHLKF